MARAVILTGERGAGKTTLCLALAASSPRYRGIVSPRLFDAAGNRVGVAARCLATGDEWVLGRSDRELDGPRYGRFSFSSAGLERAVECLRGVLRHSPPPGTSAAPLSGAPVSQPGAPATLGEPPVVIIDEIGPLELELNAGLAAVLPLLADAGHLLLVARPSLIARLQDFVPRHEREVLVVEPVGRDSLAAVLAGRFVEDSSG